jgi:hypothetical protein
MQGSLLSQDDVITWSEPISVLVPQPSRLKLISRNPGQIAKEGWLLSNQSIFLCMGSGPRMEAETVQTVSPVTIPEWGIYVLNSIEKLLRLPEGWDSYDAKQINPGSVKTLVILLAQSIQRMLFDVPIPFVVPTVGGGIQLEWHQSGTDLEIEIPPSGKPVVSFVNLETGADWEREINLWDDILPTIFGPLISNSSEQNNRS